MTTREGLRGATIWMTFDAGRAMREIGYGPTVNWRVSKDEAFARTVMSVKSILST